MKSDSEGYRKLKRISNSNIPFALYETEMKTEKELWDWQMTVESTTFEKSNSIIPFCI